jgi:hypothetical protein
MTYASIVKKCFVNGPGVLGLLLVLELRKAIDGNSVDTLVYPLVTVSPYHGLRDVLRFGIFIEIECQMRSLVSAHQLGAKFVPVWNRPQKVAVP